MTSGRKKRVLFVCVGNCCRSQMAEGFAAHHGGDVLMAESAGLVPAGVVVDETVAGGEHDIRASIQGMRLSRLLTTT